MAAGEDYTKGGLNTDIMAEMWQGACWNWKTQGEWVQTYGRMNYGSWDCFSPSRVNQTCPVSHEGQPEAYSFRSQKVEFVHKYVTACGNHKLFLSQEMQLVRSDKCIWSPQR